MFGFRYAEAESDLEIAPENITAIAVYSDMAQTGFFDSSNELLNRFVAATLWSTKGNSLDVPTDCPTRERHGWTGDAQIFFETAGYLMDYAPFARKYVQDLYDWQKKSGKLPQIAPYGGVDFYMSFMNGSVGWADAGVLIPYRWEGTMAQGGIASLNHYSKGAVCEWLFKTMCGIRVDGKNHFTIAPRPGGHFTHAKAGYQSVYGLVESGWEKNGDSYTLTVRIPCNTTAELILPSGDHDVVSAGMHQFTWKVPVRYIYTADPCAML